MIRPLVLLLLLFPAVLRGELLVERVTTVVPFPRGLEMVDGSLYVLARGRVRGAGGVTAEVEDRAGTLFRVDPGVAEPFGPGEAGEAVRTNGELFAPPSAPPFKLWNRASDPPESDRLTDRPYCTLRYHAPTHSFYICGFSGVDLRRTPEYPVAFSKNLTDAILRFDLRTQRWYEVERHDIRAGGTYPHHDPRTSDPPHGWLNGPDNVLPVANSLYAVAKDNSVLVRYDLSRLVEDPEAGAPGGEIVLGSDVYVEKSGTESFHGHSALAHRDGWLYVGTRTSSVIYRFRVDGEGRPVEPLAVQVVARFDPYDPVKKRSADITDMGFDDDGFLYVVSAKPSRVYRFLPDPANVFDARGEGEQPWADLATATNNPAMKSENVLWHDGWLYVTSGDGYGYQAGADGTVYRVRRTNQ
ncbi:MAG: hypothetical protein PWP23_1922 [Candidatus Sumerlaeota bacterium]|nr:hypothetical protein [Candidatus Sumerlaeota bacterium]